MTGPLPLGRAVDYPREYDASLLFPIERAQGRDSLGLDPTALPFVGNDRWHAYELSWLDRRGKPVVAAMTLQVPADTPRLVESKSLKLYLNSFNATRFEDPAAVRARIAADLSHAAGGEVAVFEGVPGAGAGDTFEHGHFPASRMRQVRGDACAHGRGVFETGGIERVEVQLQRLGFDQSRRVRRDLEGHRRHHRLAAAIEPRQFIGMPAVVADEGQRRRVQPQAVASLRPLDREQQGGVVLARIVDRATERQWPGHFTTKSVMPTGTSSMSISTV